MNDEIQRLGKHELGRHAFEDRMPKRVQTIIENESVKNKSVNVIPVLAQRLQQDKAVTTAYLCNHEVKQIYKIRNEGNHFCAYRNIQMILGRGFSIPDIQETIEAAWDKGFNSHGRIETGGIKGTRKHIGTSEAQALLRYLGIACQAHSFKGTDAWKDLIDLVTTYFSSQGGPAGGNIHQTDLPPLFLQRPNHSLTIVGIEHLQSGKRRLIVFDPGYRPPRPQAWFFLRSYRRSETYLKRYHSFEVLQREKWSRNNNSQ